jgi:hypothetical protein
MRRVTPGLIALSALALSGCHDAIGIDRGGPALAIHDASHGAGNAHFYWSTPIVADPGAGGTFDPTQQPVVQVCEWNGSTCVATVAEFRPGSGADGIKVDIDAERYHVNWHTGECNRGPCVLKEARIYRIRVLVAGLEAGHADVYLVSSRAAVKQVNTAAYVPLVSGTTLPIRFRLEHGLTLFAADAPALPRLARASQRYRNAGVKPGTGRDGTAAVEGRALLAADGTTLVELTTGHLDQTGTPPGNIDKVQFKQLNASGEAVYTLNYTGLTGGGSWSQSVTGPVSRARLLVQANITGIDGERTSVVTVPITVGLLPDLAVKDLTMPATATPGIPTVISATVAENNGDTGATGDCRLYVNDTLVDEARAIWVDAGDEVSCTFAHTFAQPGTNTVRVTLENVTPGDDDGSNNVVNGSLALALSNHTNVSNFADAAFREYDNYRQTWSVRQQITRLDDPSFLMLEEYGETREEHSRYIRATHQWSSSSAGLGNEIAFPLASVRVLQRSGAVVLADYTLSNLHATSTTSWDDGSRRSCYQAAAPAGQAGWVSICTEVETYQPPGQPVQTTSRTWVYADAIRGRVQYLGHYFYRWVYTPYGEDYGSDTPYLTDEQHGDGTFGELGPDMTWEFDVQGVRASTGEALTYTAHLAEPWQGNTTETFDGSERCNTDRLESDVWVQEYRNCATTWGTYRTMHVQKALLP